MALVGGGDKDWFGQSIKDCLSGGQGQRLLCWVVVARIGLADALRIILEGDRGKDYFGVSIKESPCRKLVRILAWPFPRN